jgi:hypothetical protein
MSRRNYSSFEPNDPQVGNLSSDEAENVALPSENDKREKLATKFSCGFVLSAVTIFVISLAGAIILY